MSHWPYTVDEIERLDPQFGKELRSLGCSNSEPKRTWKQYFWQMLKDYEAARLESVKRQIANKSYYW